MLFRALTAQGTVRQRVLIAQYREAGEIPKLATIAWPGGGFTQFDLPNQESAKVLDAIVLMATRGCAWWETVPSEGGDSVPSCVPDDGLRGQATAR